MKNIVFLGSKAIGYECLNFLVEQSNTLDLKIVGVLTSSNDRFNYKDRNVENLAIANAIPILANLDQYLALENVDIAISIQYHQILQKIHIDKASQITINLHMAPLPEYRGCNQFSFAIINGDAEFGTTIHRLEEGIDTGAIIAEKRFPIPKDCFVDELYQLTFLESINLFQSTVPKIVSGEMVLTPQRNFAGIRKFSTHYRKEMEALKQIDLS